MSDSLHLLSGVTVIGAGEKTVLRKAPMARSALSADLGYGHFDVSLAEPDKFRVGMGIHIRDDNSGGFYNTVATLTWREGDRFGTSRMLNHDYSRGRNAVVRSVFPVISGYNVKDARIEQLTIEGNKELNEYIDGCRGGGIFLSQASNVVMRHITVRGYCGDGISFQQTVDTLIEDCLCENNHGHGLHPGSGSVRPVMRRVVCRGNAHDGIFYCLRVSFSLTEDCLIEDNSNHGISVGGRDTDHLIRNNTIRRNGLNGLYFRPSDAAMAGHRCLFQGNVLSENCARDSSGEVFIDGETMDVHILGNSLTAKSYSGRPAAGVVVGEKASRIVVHGNRIKPDSATAVAVRGAKDSVSTKRPSGALPVGPKAAPPKAAWHLSVVRNAP
jgi:nitrous oxidase accessory protein NosD